MKRFKYKARWWKWLGCEIIHYGPCRRTVLLHDSYINAPFPDQLFIINKSVFGDVLQYGWLKEPITEATDLHSVRLYFPFLPNVGCHTVAHNVMNHDFLCCCHPSVEAFWRSPFSGGCRGDSIRALMVGSARRWEETTATALQLRMGKGWLSMPLRELCSKRISIVARKYLNSERFVYD